MSSEPRLQVHQSRRTLDAFENWFGTRVRVTPPNPLSSVWVAELHDIYSGTATVGDRRFSFRLSVTGENKTDALERLDDLLGEIGALMEGADHNGVIASAREALAHDERLRDFEEPGGSPHKRLEAALDALRAIGEQEANDAA